MLGTLSVSKLVDLLLREFYGLRFQVSFAGGGTDVRDLFSMEFGGSVVARVAGV